MQNSWGEDYGFITLAALCIPWWFWWFHGYLVKRHTVISFTMQRFCWFCTKELKILCSWYTQLECLKKQCRSCAHEKCSQKSCSLPIWVTEVRWPCGGLTKASKMQKNENAIISQSSLKFNYSHCGKSKINLILAGVQKLCLTLIFCSSLGRVIRHISDTRYDLRLQTQKIATAAKYL